MSAPFRIDEAIEVLERTPAVLHAWLHGLGRTWTHGDYGAGTFCPYDVVGHLIHGEKADWIPRARIVLEHGTGRAFEPFDRYAMFEESAARPIADLLEEFTRLRRENLAALREMNLTTEQLRLRGMHPALGEVTLEQLLATWVAHDLNHLGQIAKALATQYADAVGPWREYLSILHTPAAIMDATAMARRARATGAER